jgi:hypothetical protein
VKIEPGIFDKKESSRQAAKMDENAIGRIVVDTALQIHRELGPGLLESVYEIILAKELAARGQQVERQVAVPIVYRGLRFDEGFRADHGSTKPLRSWRLGVPLNR